MDIQKLTKEQAVIISGFTGILCGEFSDFHADVEKRLGRGVQTFEFGFKEFATEVKKLYEADFIEMGTVDKEQAKAQVVPEGFGLFDGDTLTYSNGYSINCSFDDEFDCHVFDVSKDGCYIKTGMTQLEQAHCLVLSMIKLDAKGSMIEAREQKG